MSTYKMTSSGANTWSIPLELNNLESQIASGDTTGVQTVTAGANITITGTAQNPVINSSAGSSGVTSIASGSGISVNQSTGAVTVSNVGVTSLSSSGGIAVNTSTGAVSIKNTGVLSITSGTGINLTGSASDPVINSYAVQSVIAGANVTVTGTSANPIINATAQTSVANGKVSYTNFVFDGTGNIITIPANQLGNAFVYCNTPNSVAQTLYLPNVNELTAFFGANAVVNFFIGQLNVSQFNPEYPNSALGVFIINPTGNEYWANNYVTQAPNSSLVVKTWTNYNVSISVHFPALYKVQLTIQGGKAFYYYDYAGFSFP